MQTIKWYEGVWDPKCTFFYIWRICKVPLRGFKRDRLEEDDDASKASTVCFGHAIPEDSLSYNVFRPQKSSNPSLVWKSSKLKKTPTGSCCHCAFNPDYVLKSAFSLVYTYLHNLQCQITNAECLGLGTFIQEWKTVQVEQEKRDWGSQAPSYSRELSSIWPEILSWPACELC
jgi:hypothetical protein